MIAVSHFTARQLTELLGVESARIRVIHHGVTPPPAAPPDDNERENIILHVGAIQTRKNLVRLIRAFEQAPSGWKLVLAGSQGYGAPAVIDCVNSSPRRADIALPGYVAPAELEAYYSRARIFAFPSLDEGFGMPVLDAMARGVPVVTSAGSALREVAGDAALLVDPAEVDAIAQALASLTLDADLRRTLRMKGLQRAAEFSWAEAVQQTWQVYTELL